MKILFVDNHAAFTAVVVETFLPGHEVVTVPTITAARRALTEPALPPFDVALVDYDLDDGKGDELVRWCRATNLSRPLIAVSARADGNTALLAARADRACAKIDFARIGAVLAELVVTSQT